MESEFEISIYKCCLKLGWFKTKESFKPHALNYAFNYCKQLSNEITELLKLNYVKIKVVYTLMCNLKCELKCV